MSLTQNYALHAGLWLIEDWGVVLSPHLSLMSIPIQVSHTHTHTNPGVDGQSVPSLCLQKFYLNAANSGSCYGCVATTQAELRVTPQIQLS